MGDLGKNRTEWHEVVKGLFTRIIENPEKSKRQPFALAVRLSDWSHEVYVIVNRNTKNALEHFIDFVTIRKWAQEMFDWGKFVTV